MKTLSALLAFSIIIVSCNDQKIENITTSNDSIISPPVIDTPALLIEKEISIVDTPNLIRSLSKNILNLLKQKDYTALAEFFHPAEGVRFSPYGYIDTVKDQRLSAAQFLKLTGEEKKLTWGTHHGSGDPILLSLSEYFKSYVYNADFINAEKTGYNKMIGKGNSINNLLEIYPSAHFTESHFSGFNNKYKGMDWTSLRLVFKPYKNSFFLVGIIHDQWTG